MTAAMGVHILLVLVHHSLGAAVDSTLVAVVVERHTRTLGEEVAAGGSRTEVAALGKEAAVVAVAAGIVLALEGDTVPEADTGPEDTGMAAAHIGLEVAARRTVLEAGTVATAAVVVGVDIGLEGVPGEEDSRVHHREMVRVLDIAEGGIVLVVVADRETHQEARGSGCLDATWMR